MNFSKETFKLADLCWSGDQIRSTQVEIGMKYEDAEGNKFKITEETYKELLEYQGLAKKKYKVERLGKTINLIGALQGQDKTILK